MKRVVNVVVDQRKKGRKNERKKGRKKERKKRERKKDTFCTKCPRENQ